MRSFLGLVGWYRRFISSFSSRGTALTDLTRKNPDFDLPFMVQTDASGQGLGAVLLQGEREE